MQQAQPRGLPGLAIKGLGEPEQSGEAPSRLFRGWQANPNSIFGDGVLQRAQEECLRLQMDVWFCAPQEPCLEAKTALVPNAKISPGGSYQHVDRATPSALLTLLIMDGPFSRPFLEWFRGAK
jgi:hypothetical protein